MRISVYFGDVLQKQQLNFSSDHRPLSQLHIYYLPTCLLNVLSHLPAKRLRRAHGPMELMLFCTLNELRLFGHISNICVFANNITHCLGIESKDSRARLVCCEASINLNLPFAKCACSRIMAVVEPALTRRHIRTARDCRKNISLKIPFNALSLWAWKVTLLSRAHTKNSNGSIVGAFKLPPPRSFSHLVNWQYGCRTRLTLTASSKSGCEFGRPNVAHAAHVQVECPFVEPISSEWYWNMKHQHKERER